MKISMIGHKAVPSSKGGIEAVLTNVCPILAEKGIEVVCYNRTSDKVEDEYANDIKNGTYKGVVLKKAGTLKIRRISALLSSFTASAACIFNKSDIIHFHAEGPSGAMFLPKLFGKKCVATVHGLDWQREKWKNGIGAKYIKFGERMIAKYADGIIVLNRSTKEYFKETYRRDTQIIYNGVSKPVIIDDDIIYKKFGLKKDTYICVVARLTEEKGIHYLIDAFNRIKTDKKLVICGEASDSNGYVKRIKTAAFENERIVFTGFVSGATLASVYSNAYLVCQTSNIEGMSVSLLEALAYSNAVLCSDIPENSDVCGNSAVYFRRGDTDDLKEKLEMMLNNKDVVENLRLTASQSVLSKYSWEKTADETAEFYKNILKGER